MDFPLVKFDPNTGVATLGMPTVPRPLRGIQKLVQIVVIAVLKNGGQDVFAPIEGSGLRALIGQFNYSDEQEVRVELSSRVNKIQREVIQNQAPFPSPPAEKLRSLKVLEIAVDPVTSSAFLRLQVISEAGQTAQVVI